MGTRIVYANERGWKKERRGESKRKQQRKKDKKKGKEKKKNWFVKIRWGCGICGCDETFERTSQGGNKDQDHAPASSRHHLSVPRI